MLKRKPSNVSEKEKHQKPKRSSSFGNFDRFRSNSTSKPDDPTGVHEGEPINESGEQNKTSNNGRGLGKKMRAISWTMKKKTGKKYIKALSEEKDEEDAEDTLPYRNSDPMIGTHTEKVSIKASDSMDSLYSGQSSSSDKKESACVQQEFYKNIIFNKEVTQISVTYLAITFG